MKARYTLGCMALITPLIGWLLWTNPPARVAKAAERKVLFYQDSMHPWVKSDQPGKCTICAMDLTPIYEGQQGFGISNNLVVLSSNGITVLNVQAEAVQRRALKGSQRVAGTLDANETTKTIISADDLAHFNRQLTKLASALTPLQKELAAPHRWADSVQRLAALSRTEPAKNLAAARVWFLPFSMAMVDLAKQLRKEVPALAGLKIHHCPMAPKPGLWLQLKGPLRNRFLVVCGLLLVIG
jgi:hypothetical protein